MATIRSEWSQNMSQRLLYSCVHFHFLCCGAGDPDNGKFPGDEALDRDESNELTYLLKSWKQQGKVILNVEYAQEPSNLKDAYNLGKENRFRTT